MPVSLSVGAPLTNDLTMTGTGCNEQGVDFVACFVPASSCVVTFDCIYNPPGAATVSANVYEGTCSTTPATCLNSDSGPNFGSVIVALTAGTQYCVVCESSVNATNLFLEMDADGAANDCGSLPVELMSFSISAE